MTEREETNVTQGKCLCVDVGGSAIKYGIIGPDLKLTDKGDIPTPHGGVEPYLAALEKLYKSVEGQVQGIAMSVPGVIDSENGICISGGNLSFIHNYNLAGEMTKRCKVPVTVMNDAKSAAMAEAKWGALSDCRDGIVIVLGTGIGGALIITAFQAASGLVNLITPTAAVVMGGLAFGNVPYDRWVRFIWKLILIFFLLTVAFLAVSAVL